MLEHRSPGRPGRSQRVSQRINALFFSGCAHQQCGTTWIGRVQLQQRGPPDHEMRETLRFQYFSALIVFRGPPDKPANRWRNSLPFRKYSCSQTYVDSNVTPTVSVTLSDARNAPIARETLGFDFCTPTSDWASVSVSWKGRG